MQIHFLCPSHRVWFNRHPEFARVHFYQSLGATQHHRKYHAWPVALAYAGSAFEVAEILLDKYAESLHPIVIYTSSAILLSDTFDKLENNDKALQVLHLCYQRLNKELITGDKPRLGALFRCIALVTGKMRELWHDKSKAESGHLPINISTH
ncbi:hypothetical protein [Lacimicrobium alkaliphilum]|uniref:Uncharacterized protein n=1 Tax=Lacimicrobium alkaliphilum TaxID=1526571 RepID=A0ABQ1RII3_9ALTE|nr:hypothetical protein [Lacimicrobium alkaliphilum]GGD71552.1 hypothetical protein GCM10011357_28250 [Lacimicrobium alkaliphilum]